jgi:hypothetical protein
VRRSLLTFINVGLRTGPSVVVGVRPTLPVEDISLLFGIDMAGDKVNDHLLHSDGDISHYFIDKEQQSCLNTDED